MPFAPPKTAKGPPPRDLQAMLWVSNNQNFHKCRCAAISFHYDLWFAKHSLWELLVFEPKIPPATSSPSTENTPGMLNNYPYRVPFKCMWIPNNVPQPNSSWHRAGLKGWGGARSHEEQGWKEIVRRMTWRVTVFNVKMHSSHQH